jgi:hypothetical protein
LCSVAAQLRGGLIVDRSGWNGVSAGNGGYCSIGHEVQVREVGRKPHHVFGDPTGVIHVEKPTLVKSSAKQAPKEAFNFFAMSD